MDNSTHNADQALIDSSPKPGVPCVCCWTPIKDLTKHYPVCSYIKGDWSFWASPNSFDVYFDQQVFINHLKSFKHDERLIEATSRNYVTARVWATQFPEEAKKRQLNNTLYEYFTANPQSLKEWEAQNGGNILPKLTNIGDISKVLTECSKLLRKHSEGVSPIDQLKRMFRISTEAAPEASTQQAILSKKRRRNSLSSVSYTALDIINPGNDVKVEIAGAASYAEWLADYQQRELEPQNRTRHMAFGGVVHGGSTSGIPGPSNLPGSRTTNTILPLGNQSQLWNEVFNNTANNFDGAQNLSESSLAYSNPVYQDWPLPPTMLQNPSQIQTTPNATNIPENGNFHFWPSPNNSGVTSLMAQPIFADLEAPNLTLQQYTTDTHAKEYTHQQHTNPASHSWYHE